MRLGVGVDFAGDVGGGIDFEGALGFVAVVLGLDVGIQCRV